MRVVGIDFGRRRVGLAISDATATLARPLSTLTIGAGGDVASHVCDELERLARELAHEDETIDTLVVGMPRRLDGAPSDQTAAVERLVEQLRARMAVPVVVEGERLTSREAESRLALRERDWRRRKEKLDAAAAAIVLQDYLDRRRST